MVQFSSSLPSFLPVGASAVKVSVAGSNDAMSVATMKGLVLARSIVPLGRTVDCASPMPPVPTSDHVPGTVICPDHVLVTRSYMKPMLVHTWTPPPLYSPPMTTTRPSGSTAEAKYSGLYRQFTHPMVGSLPFGMSATVKPGTSHEPF